MQCILIYFIQYRPYWLFGSLIHCYNNMLKSLKFAFLVSSVDLFTTDINALEKSIVFLTKHSLSLLMVTITLCCCYHSNLRKALRIVI